MHLYRSNVECSLRQQSIILIPVTSHLKKKSCYLTKDVLISFPLYEMLIYCCGAFEKKVSLDSLGELKTVDAKCICHIAGHGGWRPR